MSRIKYDYGYEIKPGTVYAWAMQHIGKGSRVLEIGPSIGILCKHLTQEHGCTVDIIEYDEESGKQAAQFANISAIGPVEGSIEREEWKALFPKGAYDFIVIQDVMEHLYNPRAVVDALHDYLKPDGSLILSVPNVAHNSVILGLYKNDFTYTDLGLLDDTHVHFFAYRTIRGMLEASGYSIAAQDATAVRVSEAEIEAAYTDAPKGVSKHLMTRTNANAYQYIFKCDHDAKRAPLPPLRINNLDDEQYRPVAYFLSRNGQNEDTALGTYKFDAPFATDAHLSLSLDAYPEATHVRIDPMSAWCVLNEVSITDAGGRSLPVTDHNATQSGEAYVFQTDDPVLVAALDADTKGPLDIRFHVASFDDSACVGLLMQASEIQAASEQRLASAQGELYGLQGELSNLHTVLSGAQEALVDTHAKLEAEAHAREDFAQKHQAAAHELAVAMESIKQLEYERDTALATIEMKEGQLADYADEFDALRTKLEAAAQRDLAQHLALQEKEAALFEATQSLEATGAEKERIATDYALLYGQHEALAEDLRRMEASRSWRVTKPLRAMTRMMRR